MFQVNNSSESNYTDLDQNKSSTKGWSCVTMACAVMVIIIGICSLIYGFNGGRLFELNTSLIKNWNVNDGINVRPNVDYSWAFEGVSDLDMLSDGDIITIRGLNGGFLRNQSGDRKVKAVNEYSSNRDLWKVGISYHSGSKTYSFKNFNGNCYLTAINSDYLKCHDLGSRSYWIANTDSAYFFGDSSDKKRYYTILENDITGACLYVGDTEDSKISTDSVYCDYAKSMVLFEIVKGGTSTSTSSSYTGSLELIDSSLKIEDDWSSSVSLTGKNFLGRGNINALNSGNIVTIRGLKSGLLHASNGIDKVGSTSIFQDNPILWIVGYDSGRKAYYFKNYGNSNCYMRTSDGNVLKCSSTLDDQSYWIDGGSHYRSGDSSDYPRVYTSLKNYDTNKCLKIDETYLSKIELKSNVCGSGSAQSWVRFEIVSYN